MNPQQTARARYHTYHLLGRLYLEGVTAELLAQLRPLPALLESVPHPFEADQSAADHHHLFHFNLFPYETIFLDPQGLLGGTNTERVAHAYHQAGYRAETTAVSADHLGHQLGLLAFWCGAEATAKDEQTARAARQAQSDFLHEHLWRWLPPCLIAIKQHALPFYEALADLTWALAASHDVAHTASPPFQLPQPPTLLDNPQTRLPQIAAYLLTPSYTALFVSRQQISHMAHQLGLPCGFGPRQQMLTNLLRAASHYDRFDALLDAWLALMAQWQTQYRAKSATAPTLAPFIEVWLTRLQASREVVLDIQRQAAVVV